MATRGVEMTITYVAWDTSNNVGKTGDVANHTLRWVKDGTSGAPTNSASEVDATNAPGLYKLTLTSTETDANIGVLHGASSTANISIMPTTIQFERLPNAAPGGNGGVPTVDANNRIAGVQGTINTLDGLDSAQDSQHATTQAAIAGLNDFDPSTDTVSLDADQSGVTVGTVNALGTQAKADVNAEVDSAIETYHLDHIFAAAYDPTSKPGNASGLLNVLVENDGGVPRYTVNALENAPSGSGASAEAIADAVWDEARSGHTTAGTFGEGVASVQGNVTGSVASVTNGVTVSTNNDKSGYDLNADQSGVTIGTCTTNTDMRGTDNALLASDAPANFDTLVIDANGHMTAGTVGDKTGYTLSTAGVTAVQNGLATQASVDALPDETDISNQVASDLATAHGGGSWETATGFSTHSAADVRTEMDSNSTQLAAILEDTGTTIPGTLSTIVSQTGDIYHAFIDLRVDDANSQDEWTVVWFKNDAAVTSGITSPTIQVVKRADGTDLIAETAMTQIGSTGMYKYDEGTDRTTAGEAVIAIVSATIDGSERTWRQPLGRDSSA